MTTKKGILLFAALFVLFYILIYVVPTVSDIFRQTYIAKYGTLDISCEAKCVFVRDEVVYNAPAGGAVDRNANEGDLVKAGNIIAKVGGKEVRNEETGVVSYCYDGYESKLSSENIAELKSDFFKKYKESDAKIQTASQKAELGETIFKIVDRSEWYLVFWLDKEEAELFTTGKRVSVDFGEDDKDGSAAEDRLRMTVKSITAQGEEFQVILSCNRDYEAFDEYRIKDCTVITSSNSGLIINTDSIGEEDGLKGVYVVDKFGNANFTPIQIYSSHKNDTVIANDYFYDSKGYSIETVENYDEILKKPKHEIAKDKPNAESKDKDKSKDKAKDKDSKE